MQLSFFLNFPLYNIPDITHMIIYCKPEMIDIDEISSLDSQ